MTQFQSHIQELGERLSISRWLHVESAREAYADTLDRVVAVPEATDETTYYAVLHELGHVAHQHVVRESLVEYLGLVPPNTARLKGEGEAWLWARDNAAHPITPEAAGWGVQALSSYRPPESTAVVPPEYDEALAWLRSEAA